jgi:hypothetical protein
MLVSMSAMKNENGGCPRWRIGSAIFMANSLFTADTYVSRMAERGIWGWLQTIPGRYPYISIGMLSTQYIPEYQTQITIFPWIIYDLGISTGE